MHSEKCHSNEINLAEYTSQLFIGLVEQMMRDGRIGTCGEIGSVTAEEPSGLNIADVAQYWDEISGEPLDTEEVNKARSEEIIEVRKHNVYTKVPITECWDNTGKAPTGTRWIDVNKGDSVHKEYRSRLVAQEIKMNKREDLFAATPPLEAKKMLFSLAVTEGIG